MNNNDLMDVFPKIAGDLPHLTLTIPGISLYLVIHAPDVCH